tara:strand:+ start:43 stop:606 length:564 start_codon:yes stop_codon:yes gene_type:complete
MNWLRSLGKSLGIGLTGEDMKDLEDRRRKGMIERGVLKSPEEQYAMAEKADTVTPSMERDLLLRRLEKPATEGKAEDKIIESLKTMDEMPIAEFGEKTKAGAENLRLANIMAKNFDPSNREQVKGLQVALRQAGFKDFEGEELKADGTFGKKTEFALRSLQDLYDRPNIGIRGADYPQTQSKYTMGE